MAVTHEAERTPGTFDLLARWLPTRPWAGGTTTELQRVDAANRPALTGTWPGQDDPVVLAVLEETA